MIEVGYSKKFLKMFKVLDADLQDRVEEKIEQFRNRKNHKVLKVHKLAGNLKDLYAFSIDRKNRIIFEYTGSKNEVAFLIIGGHDIY
ncbi:MAG: type II toxin-antitoxin system mRNA interferase toxin, RelE/StbE family [Candidatus Pacebacteria bacterium]|nr:type II toxin-antitoxin system mRNA interferase toxin, RelE/StbE family [Candidatus Paceibacterota bacterium]